MKRLFVLLFAMTLGVGISAQAYASLTFTDTDTLSTLSIYDSAKTASLYNLASSYQDDVYAGMLGDLDSANPYRKVIIGDPNYLADIMSDVPTSAVRRNRDDGYSDDDVAKMRGDHHWPCSYRWDDYERYPGDHCKKFPSIPLPGALGLFGAGLAGLAATKMLEKRRHE